MNAPEKSNHGNSRADSGFLSGGGEMGALMRERDWSETPLGRFEEWPQSLKTSVSTCLNSRFAILVWWGRELVMLYNDAYRQVIGNKHPDALGAPGRKVWPEIWHIISPMLEGVMARGEATWSDNLLLELERAGYPEELYFTFSYSPIRDESGDVGGVFTPVQETTAQVIGERRLRTLRDLAESARGSNARSVAEVCRLAAESLANNPQDIPFAAFYLFTESGVESYLAASTGFPNASVLIPAVVRPGETAWTFASAIQADQAEVVLIPPGLEGVPCGAWPVAPAEAMVLPIAPGGKKAGALILGASPRKRLDDDYRSFFSLVAGHVSTALSEARAFEQERNRAEALAQLDLAKTTFFSNVSHEFRTPLTLMLGPLEEILSRADDLPPSVRDMAAVTYRNGLRLQKLVNTLLEFSRIEAGRTQASYVPTDLAGLTLELASAFSSLMDKAGLHYVVECSPLRESVYVDREMWERVVLNLLSNALKYTFEGGITVRLIGRDDGAELSVEDTGTGIPEDQLPLLFERFHRVEGARGRTQEGTGIGLALVSELTRLHGGKVDVRSTPGKGSTFTVFIPFGSAHLPEDRLRDGREAEGPRRETAGHGADAYVSEAARWLPEASVPADPMDSFFLAPVSDGVRDGRVLIADDNSDMRGYIARLLSARYEVELASNGEEALARVLERPPDLVLSDVMMPRLDGFGMIRALRANPDTSTLPVILLSARAGEEARVEGLDEGATDYLVKPFTARELLARVSAHVEMARVRQRAARRESDLRAEAEKARDLSLSVLESITDGFFSLDSDWCFTYANAACQELLGKSTDELIGRNHWDLYPATLGTIAEREYRRAVRDKVPVEFEIYYEPWQRWFAIKAYPTDIGGISVHFRDITEHKLAAQTARESQEHLRALSDLTRNVIEASPYAVEVLDRSGHTILINEQGRRLRPAGVPWIGFWDENHRPLAEECLATALAGHAGHFSASAGRDGAAIWLDVSTSPLMDAEGNVVQVLSITRDVTDARKAEEDLRQTAKLESLGVMAGGIAHDFNNLLTGIMGNASMLADSVTESDRALAEDIVLASERAADLTRQMLAFAGKGRFQISRTDLCVLVRELLRLVRPSIERNVEIQLELRDHCIVEGDTGQLQQVIMNLLINAGEAMDGKPGLIVVRTGRMSADRAFVTQSFNWGDAAEGEYVFLEVVDNGKGMDEKTRSKIFDPFFTTKFQGRGLGLAAVSGIVRGHKGMLRVQSEPGVGTTFRVLFPSAEPAAIVPEKSEVPSRRASAVVLLVDDEAIVRRVGSEVLKRNGYEVKLASDGREALDLFRANRREIDVIVLDMVMPVMGGETALRQIREIDARVPVIVCSGYNEVEVIRRFTEQKVGAFLQKPYSASQLLEKIQEILTRDARAAS